jgi:hypothetical protein
MTTTRFSRNSVHMLFLKRFILFPETSTMPNNFLDLNHRPVTDSDLEEANSVDQEPELSQ